MPGSIRLINVNGLSAIVDINTTGTPTEFTAYSDLACTQTVALPATITTDTTFYVKATGVVMLSVTVDGTELAGPAGVTLSNAGPATFSLDTDSSNDKSGTLLGLVSTHSSGGSSAGLPTARILGTGPSGNDLAYTDLTTFTWIDASVSAATSAFTVDLTTSKVTINEDGLYFAELLLENANITAAGSLSYDSTGTAKFGGKKYLNVAAAGDLSLLSLFAASAGDTIIPEEFGDGALAGTFGSPQLTVVQFAKGV